MTMLLECQPATLTLAGVMLRAMVDPPAAAARYVVAAVTLDDRGRPQHHVPALVALTGALVHADDQAALTTVLSDRSRLVTPRRLADCARWLVEEATGRPFGEARTLCALSLVEWRRWRGRLLSRGVAEPTSLADLCDVADAMLDEDVTAAAAARMAGFKPGRALDRIVVSAWRERDSWGSGGDAGAGLMAMVAKDGRDDGA